MTAREKALKEVTDFRQAAEAYAKDGDIRASEFLTELANRKESLLKQH